MICSQLTSPIICMLPGSAGINGHNTCCDWTSHAVLMNQSRRKVFVVSRPAARVAVVWAIRQHNPHLQAAISFSSSFRLQRRQNGPRPEVSNLLLSSSQQQPLSEPASKDRCFQASCQVSSAAGANGGRCSVVGCESCRPIGDFLNAVPCLITPRHSRQA
jgi:hypothetical protein